MKMKIIDLFTSPEAVYLLGLMNISQKGKRLMFVWILVYVLFKVNVGNLNFPREAPKRAPRQPRRAPRRPKRPPRRPKRPQRRPKRRPRPPKRPQDGPKTLQEGPPDIGKGSERLRDRDAGSLLGSEGPPGRGKGEGKN